MGKRLIKQTVAAALLTTSVLSFSPVAFGATSVDQSVNKVKAELNKATTHYVYPSLDGKLAPSSALYPVLNSAKKNYQLTRKAVVSSKLSSSQKNAKLKEIDALYNEKISGGLVPYIDAYNYTTKYLVPIMNEIKAAEARNDFAAVEKAYHKLSYQLKGRTAILYRFSGKAGRDLLLAEYKKPADVKREELMVPVTIYMKTVEVKDLLAADKKEEAKKVLAEIEALLNRLPNASTDKFVAALLEEVAKVQKEVNGTTPVTPVTPPVSGGGGGGGGSAPTGNDLLNEALRSQLAAGNGAADGAVDLTLNGKKITVLIENESSTLGDFKAEAKPVFNAFKTNVVVNSATVNYTTSSGSVTISSDTINNNQDFETVIQKALEKVGLSDTDKLNLLTGKSITFQVSGTINNKEFNDTYIFEFTE